MNGTPIVNLNGTDRKSLIHARLTASEAIRNATKAVGECRPHGRDYQTAPSGEYEAAIAIFSKRFAFLNQLVNELLDEALAIHDQ